MKAAIPLIILALCAVSPLHSQESAQQAPPKNDTKAGELTGGIGALLDRQGDDWIIKSTVPGSAAETAGLKPGNRISSVDGKSVQGLALPDILSLLRGKVGTVVSLTVVQDLGVSKTVEVTRSQLRPATAANLAGSYVYEDDPSIIIVIERGPDNQYTLKCPQQHWTGTGWVGKGEEHSAFKGIFRMEDHPDVTAGLRGAVGYMRIDYQPGDQLRVRTQFNFYESGNDKMRDKILIRRK